MTITALSHDTWLDEWHAWHDRRWAEVSADHGIAALVSHTWLTDRSVEIDGLPGRWSARDGEVHGRIADTIHVIAPLGSLAVDDRVIRVLQTRSQLALRVFDPAAPTRTELTEIATFAPASRWRLRGRFEPLNGQTRSIQHVDGARLDDAVAGIVRVSTDGHDLSLLALPTPDGRLQVTFADTTNGTYTARFRFLSLLRPTGGDDYVEVDFNRAYLPPCTFSDHYLCPLPPVQNRLPFPVTAGETVPVHAG